MDRESAEPPPPFDPATIVRNMDDHDQAVQDAFARLALFRRHHPTRLYEGRHASGAHHDLREVCFSACGDDELAYEIAGKEVTTAATDPLSQIGGR